MGQKVSSPLDEAIAYEDMLQTRGDSITPFTKHEFTSINSDDLESEKRKKKKEGKKKRRGSLILHGMRAGTTARILAKRASQAKASTNRPPRPRGLSDCCTLCTGKDIDIETRMRQKMDLNPNPKHI